MVIRPPRPPDEAEVGDHYDELDPFYRELWGDHVHHGLWEEGDDARTAVRRLVELAADRARVGGGSRVCDVGCGYGGTARLLTRQRDARVTGYTISRTQYRRAVEVSGEGPEAPRFFLQDWLDADGGAGAFDAVLAVESTAHMERKDHFYEKAYHALRPGGRLVVCAWTAGPEVPGWQARRLLRPICREGRLASLATIEEHLRWCRRAGFRRVAADDLSDRVRRTWDVILWRTLLSLRRGATWSYLLASRSRHRRFGLTLGRIWLAYRLGALRYHLLTARRDGR